MANIPPPPTYAPVINETNDGFNPIWLKWFLDISQTLNQSGGTITTHNNLSGLQGGSSLLSQFYHLAQTEHDTLVGGTTIDASSLHTHNTFPNNLTMNGTVTANGAYTFAANATFNAGTTTTLAGTNTISGNSTFGGTATFNNTATFNSTVSGITAPSVTYTHSGTGATASTVSTRLNQTVNVLDFGADATGASDSTTAINNAITAAGAGGIVDFPAGTFKVTVAVPVSTSVRLRGAGWNKTYISTTSATLDLLQVTANYVTIEGLTFKASVARTAGNYLYMNNVQHCLVRECQFIAPFRAINNFSGLVNAYTDLLISNIVAGGEGILFDDSAGNSNVFYVTRVTIEAASKTTSTGLHLKYTSAVNITDCEILLQQYGLLIDPPTGQKVLYTLCVDTYFDTCTKGIYINGVGDVIGTKLTGCWTSSASTNGIEIAGSGNVYGTNITGHYAFDNANYGIAIVNTLAVDTNIVNSACCNNGSGGSFSGIQTFANVGSFSIIGCRLGNGYGRAGNTYQGIFIAAGSANNYRIIGNDLQGNTSGAMTDGGTGTTKTISGNLGFNPGNTTGITVGASPFTYTAGDTDEVIYVYNGTVTTVAVDGFNLFQTTNVTVHCPATKQVVVTYTGAPNMARTKL